MSTDDQQTREWVRRIFADPDDPGTEEPHEQTPTGGNVAPKEGGSADQPIRGDSDLHTFTRRLFGRDDD